MSDPRTCERCGAEARLSGGICEACYHAAWKRERSEGFQRETLRAIPPRFRWACFEATELAARVRPARLIAIARKAEDGANLVLCGPAGAGKTSIATAVLRAWCAKRECLGHWTTTFDLAKARREQRLGTGEAAAVEDAERADILLLDELGAEQGRDTAVDEIIRSRHDRGRVTIFTSGFRREDIVSRYGDGLARRVFEGSLILTLGGRE